jgi:nuclease HARBI1
LHRFLRAFNNIALHKIFLIKIYSQKKSLEFKSCLKENLSKNLIFILICIFQILVFLQFLGANTFYHTIRDSQGISPQAVSLTIRRVATAVLQLRQELIRWPEDSSDLSKKFYEIGGFPSVTGCIDGTHIPVIAPKDDEQSFLNRHHGHSFNVLGVCGPDNQFYYLNANHGGRAHDSRVLKTSSLWRTFEQGELPFPGSVLLGDSGYPLRSWLMTPFLGNPQDDARQRYNFHHAKTRSIIERTFGIWKSRFYILKTGIRVRSMSLASKLIVCCGILHNLAILHSEKSEQSEDEELENVQGEDQDREQGQVNAVIDGIEDFHGTQRRNRLLVHFQRRHAN